MNSRTIERWTASLCAVVASAVVGAMPARAADEIRDAARDPLDVFLQLDAVKGDAVDKEFPGQIKITSTDLEIKATGSKEGLHDVPAQGGEVTLVHRLDPASPAIGVAAASGQRLNKAVLTFRPQHPGPSSYTLKVTLGDLHVVSIHVNEAGQEQFVLGFTKIEWELRPPTTTTPVTRASWDITGHKVI